MVPSMVPYGFQMQLQLHQCVSRNELKLGKEGLSATLLIGSAPGNKKENSYSLK